MSYAELSSKYVIPRKNHQCEWCGTNIEIKEKCLYRTYVFESNINSRYMHLECEQAMENSCPCISDGFMTGDFKKGERLNCCGKK